MSVKTKINDKDALRDFGETVDTRLIQKSKEQMKLDSHSVMMTWVKGTQIVSEKKTQEICGRVLAHFGL